jgi:D-3-phosphoglycerate dehydrogenase
MMDWSHMGKFRVVRLNATLFPVSEYEADLYEKYGLDPVQAEAHTPEEIITHVADCDGIIVVSSALPAIVVENLNRCRVISRHGIGTDKIDVEAATRAGVLVTNVPGFCSAEMGDHAMALLLALARKLPQMSQAMVEGAWAKSRAYEVHRLSGQVLGLVGFGDSAISTARRAKGFGLRILATRRHMDSPCPEADELGVEMVDLYSLLAESDFVSLHLPLSAETYHLFDDTILRKLKPGAFLINTARGSLVDEMALVAALREGRLAGAGLDTFEQIDPFKDLEAPSDHPLLDLDNVVLTPHIASHSVEAMQDAKKGTVENLVMVLSGHWPPPEKTVNPDVAPRFPLLDYDDSILVE